MIRAPGYEGFEIAMTKDPNQPPDPSRTPVRRTSVEIAAFVAAELASFKDSWLRENLSRCLVSPRSHMRTWGWSRLPEEFECWMIAESQKYDYGIAYSDFGFGPSRPWGLVFLSHCNFGADYCWYPHLEEAFADSRFTDEHKEA